MAQTPKGSQSEEGLQWVVISDFTPGIISNSNFAFGRYPTDPVPYPKPGAAQAASTVNCIALPNGGLGPLPGVDTTVTVPDTVVPAYINGAIVYGPIGTSSLWPSGGDEMLIAYEVFNGTTRAFGLNGYQEATGDFFSPTFVSPSTSVQQALESCSMILTVFNADDTSGLTAGLPRVVISYLYLSNAGNTQVVAYYPEYPTPIDGITLLSVPFTVPAWVLGHQNRIVFLVRPIYDWTNAGGGNTYFAGAEFFDYSDPPNTVIIGDQEEYFVQEDPTGHGAWGSISASELFLVRHQGGGYVISGDLNAPTVTRLPGVTSTNGSVQIAGQTPIGFVYGSAFNGVWVWNGGNTSVKISSQLNDDFFMLTYPYPTAGPMFNFNTLGDLIYCPNNWIYSITMNSWWQWQPTAQFAAQMAWFWPTFDGQGMWCFPQSINSTDDASAFKVSRLTPSTSYEWQSYPMPFTNENQVLIRAVAVRAQGNGTIEIAFHNATGSTGLTEPTSFTINSTLPKVIRLQAAAEGVDITMQILATGVDGNAAPIVYDVRIGWEPMTLLPPALV